MFWPVRQSVSPVFLVSATPLKPLKKICNYEGHNVFMYIYTKFFFSELWSCLTYKFYQNERYLNSLSAQLL